MLGRMTRWDVPSALHYIGAAMYTEESIGMVRQQAPGDVSSATEASAAYSHGFPAYCLHFFWQPVWSFVAFRQ